MNLGTAVAGLRCRITMKISKEIRNPFMLWVQNLNQPQVEPLTLTASYNPELYPVYDNYDAIEVGALKIIPSDYFGVMGVPITFIFKHNPQQFEIVDMLAPLVNGKKKYKRVLIRRKQ